MMLTGQQAEELEWAKGVLEEAKSAGTGAFKYQGKMVDAQF